MPLVFWRRHTLRRVEQSLQTKQAITDTVKCLWGDVALRANRKRGLLAHTGLASSVARGVALHSHAPRNTQSCASVPSLGRIVIQAVRCARFRSRRRQEKASPHARRKRGWEYRAGLPCCRCDCAKHDQRAVLAMPVSMAWPRD
ncbi:hypothetical protein MRX96_036879 [Rhipicephalus microplus]